MNLNIGSVQGDCGAGLQAGIIGLVNKGQPRKLDDWGGLSAWGWGASRVLDYLETDSAVDASRVGVQGHSRAGQGRARWPWRSTSGLPSATSARRVRAAPSSTAASTARRSRTSRPASTIGWAANYLKYTGRWDAMPVDSHELIALCAPRPVFISAGNGPGPLNPDGTVPINDAWVDPRGSFLAAVAAGPVYRLLGRTDLGTIGVSGHRYRRHQRRPGFPPAHGGAHRPTRRGRRF